MRFVHGVVIPVALLGMLYCAGGVAAAHDRHTTSVGVGDAAGYAVTVICFGVSGLLFAWGVLYGFSEDGSGRIVLVALALAVVVGDLWGLFQTVVVLGGGQRPWYDTWLPVSVAFLCWWITLSLGSWVVRALTRYRRAA